MRADHTWSERLFEHRQVYGVPVSNLIIVSIIGFIVVRTMFFRLCAPLALKITSNGYAHEVKEATGRRSHQFVTRKCLKYLYHCLWFSIMCPWCFSIVSRWPDFDCTYGSGIVKTLFRQAYGLKLHPDGQVTETMDDEPLQDEFHLFMMIQLAWYFHNFIEDTIWDRHRSDFVMMIAHHIVAMLLIGLSFQAGADTCALYIVFPLDLMDFYLYYCKLFQLCTSTIDGVARSEGYRRAQSLVLYSVCATWIVTRWIMFSAAVFWMHRAFYFSEYNAVRHSAGGTSNVHFVLILILLLVLGVMQVVWGVLCIKIAITTAASGAVKDKIFNTFDEAKKEA